MWAWLKTAFSGLGQSLLGNLSLWLSIIGIAGAGYGGFHFGAESVQAKWDSSLVAQQAMVTKTLEDEQKKEQIDLADANQIETDLAKKLQAQTILTNTINQRLQDEIDSQSVYHSCTVTANGVRLYNAAVSGSAAPASRKPST